jgi:hypothetical protein
MLRMMRSWDRARLGAALVVAGLALGTGAAADAAEPPLPTTPEPTGRTVTIKVVEGGGKLRYVGPTTVAEGDTLEIVNKTNPLKVGPVTFSLVRPGQIPKTKPAQARCFTPGHICWSIAEWHGVGGDGLPTINPAEAGLPGWDTPGTSTTPGDSWYSGSTPGSSFAQEVTATAPRRLWFMDAIHPFLRGTIKVVRP